MQVETIAAAIQGDEPACRDLFNLWYQKAYRIAKSVCGSRSHAEDAVQEALVRFWKALPRLKNPETAEGYFFKIVANEAKRIQAGRKRKNEDALLDCGDCEAPAEDPQKDSELSALLVKAVDRLPEKNRTAVTLHYYGGFSEAETAEMLGISLSSVKMRLLRGRQKLKVLLEQSGYEVIGG